MRTILAMLAYVALMTGLMFTGWYQHLPMADRAWNAVAITVACYGAYQLALTLLGRGEEGDKA